MIGFVRHAVTIEMKKPGDTAFDLVGNFTATEAEISELRDVLEGQESSEVLDRIKNVLIRDVLDVTAPKAANVAFNFTRTTENHFDSNFASPRRRPDK